MKWRMMETSSNVPVLMVWNTIFASTAFFFWLSIKIKRSYTIPDTAKSVPLQEKRRGRTVNPITKGVGILWVPAPPMENPCMGCFFNFFVNQSKLIYNYRSHAKGDSQNFKIEEVEEIWNSCQISEKNLVEMEKFITWSNLTNHKRQRFIVLFSLTKTFIFIYLEILWNSYQNSEKNLVEMEKFITW